MSQAGADMTRIWRRLFRLKFLGWLRRYPLEAYLSSFRKRHFWAAQGLVILIAIAHTSFENGWLFHESEGLYLIPTGLFFVPAVYAAINFGFAGALVTVLWTTTLALPNIILQHQGLEIIREVFQILVVFTVAVFLGQRVDRERNTRQHVEAARVALRASEMKYRGLFESSPIAIFLLDAKGCILEANPTAGVLFNSTPEKLSGMAVADLVGTANARKLLNPSQSDKRQKMPLTIRLENGSRAYLEPMLTQVSDSRGNLNTQVLLKDVTEERHEQAGLRAYAAYVLRVQEEERQRISRELHDEIVQQLVWLCRQLDSVGDFVRSSPSSVIDALKQARSTAEEVVQWLRDFAKSLRPSILDDLGLVVSIRRLLVDFKERTKIECQLEVVGENRRLPSDRELGLFRIAQEALRNVEHHAKATHVSVTITFAEHEASLDLIDNGVGFVLPSGQGDLAAKGQLGLIGMEERAKLINGKLEIESSLWNGTRVTASIPI